MVNNILQTAGIILVLVASAAGIVGYFKANVSKSTIELYKADNDALRTRLDTLELQHAADDLEIKALKSAQVYLASVVTQSEQIASLRAVVERIATKVGA